MLGKNMISTENRSFSEIVEALGSDEHLSIPLLYRLTDLTPEQLDSFCGAWMHVDDERRRVVVRHLADISEENFQVDFSEIFAFCLTDNSSAVRMASLDGLGDSDRTALIEPIVELMLNDPDDQVRALAAATLGHYVLMSEWQQIPESRIKPAIRALLDVLNDPVMDKSIRRAALESIGPATHPKVSQHIEEAYDSADLQLQLSAMFAMGRSADSRWLDIVIDEMDSPIMDMRVEAARAAGMIGSTEAVSELSNLVLDEDLEVRQVAIAALGQIGGPVASGILDELAADPDMADLNEVILEALDELQWLGGGLDIGIMDMHPDQDEHRFPEA
jgi:HEAT repeat protein